jgi:hypothetical protein
MAFVNERHESRQAQLNAERRVLSDEQVRMIRASDRADRELAAELGVSHNTVHMARTGRTYGHVGAPAQRRPRARPSSEWEPTDHYKQLVIGSHGPGGLFAQTWTLAAGQCPLEAKDAAYECKHGRLPTDRTPPCGCWPQEGAVVLPISPTQPLLEAAA